MLLRLLPSILRAPGVAIDHLEAPRQSLVMKFEDLAPDAAARVGWDVLPAGKVSIDFGSSWILSDACAILDIPSLVIPVERNYLINPAHPDAASIRAVKQRRFTYDSRLR